MSDTDKPTFELLRTERKWALFGGTPKGHWQIEIAQSPARGLVVELQYPEGEWRQFDSDSLRLAPQWVQDFVAREVQA